MFQLCMIACAAFAQLPAGQIAFIQQINDESRQVCIIDAATGEQRVIVPGLCMGAPVWSPDGARLAIENFGSDGSVHIDIVNADGTAGPVYSQAARINRYPAWSPSSAKLAYSAGDSDGRQIRVLDIGTGKESGWGQPIATGADPKRKVSFLYPVWESGDMIIAVGARDEKEGRTADLYELERNSTQLMAGTRGNGTYVEWLPAMQPRGAMLAYESNDGGDREVFVYSDQRGAIDLSNHRDADWHPVWSPDGEWIAFESFRGGPRGIYKVAPQRTIVEPIAVEAVSDNWSPAWSPDGAWIAFISTRTGRPTLHICRSDGADARALTRHNAVDLAPAWRPVPSK